MTASMVFFFIVAGLSVLFALAVVFQRNPVHSAMALVMTLFLVAVLFLTLDAPLIGVFQILVYAGAIMVLFLFVVMLLSPRGVERRRAVWWAVGSLAALVLGIQLAAMISGERGRADQAATLPQGFGGAKALGWSLFHDFVLPFEIAGVLLLVAVIGAVVLAKREG